MTNKWNKPVGKMRLVAGLLKLVKFPPTVFHTETENVNI